MKRGRDGTKISCSSISVRSIPGTHGVLRIVLQLDGEEIVDAVPDIGFHHRGAEKMGERQILAHLHPVHRPRRLPGRRDEQPRLPDWRWRSWPGSRCRRGEGDPGDAVRSCFASSATWSGTARSRRTWGSCLRCSTRSTTASALFGIIEAICGARMHPELVPHRRRGAGSAEGLGRLFRDFLSYLPPRLRRVRQEVMRNRIFKARTKGVGAFTLDEAIEWGVTGPDLRACGFEWDFRKKQPYSGYEQFEFDIPTGTHGDCYDRGRGARRGDAAEPAHHRAVREQHAGRSLQIATIRWRRRRSKSAPCTTSKP